MVRKVQEYPFFPRGTASGSPNAVKSQVDNLVAVLTRVFGEYGFAINRLVEGFSATGPTLIPIAWDMTDNANDGRIKGGKPKWKAEGPTKDIQGALSFDGTDDWVDLGNPAEFQAGSLKQALTLEVWAYVNFDSGSNRIFYHGQSGGNDNYGIIFYSNNCFLFYVDTEGGGSFENGYCPASGGWFHLAMTYDGSEVRGFVDGEHVYTNTGVSGDIVSSGSDTVLSFGSSSGDDSFFEGSAAEGRIWNAVRTQTEIQDNKDRRLTGDEAGLVGYWPLG